MNIETNLRKKMQSYSKPSVAIVRVSSRGYDLSQQIQERVFSQAVIFGEGSNGRNLIEGSVKKTFQTIFHEYDVIICIMATGIVVRSIASCLQDKTSDPAIIVMDEVGKFAISLLSGHVGRANHWVSLLEENLGVQAVVTTATDRHGVMGLDTFALENSLLYENFKENTRVVNDLLANHALVGLINLSDQPVQIVKGFNWIEPSTLSEQLKPYQVILVISSQYDALDFYRANLEPNQVLVQLVPQDYVIGMGCKKQTDFVMIKKHFESFLLGENVHPLSLTEIVSIDLKKDEPGIHELAQTLGIPFRTYTKEELLPYEDEFLGSDFVKQTVGVSSVAQTSAYLASGGQVISDRYANEGVTFALGLKVMKEMNECYM